MAIHPEHPGLCAEVITIEGPLKEYDDDEANMDCPAHTITKYAQVDSDAHFGIRYTIPKNLTGECGVQVQLFLDGKKTCRHTHRRWEFGGQEDVTNCLDKICTTVNGNRYEQRFRFATLHIDEDADRDKYTPGQLKPIGTSTLQLSFVDSVTERDRTPESREDVAVIGEDKLPVLGEVAEKCLKGDVKSHQASLDVPAFAGVATSGRSKSKTKKIRNCGKPFATFHFKYRSLAALKSLHIAERTPSSSPSLPAQRGVEDLTREELEAIARNSQVKPEPGARSVKREGWANFKREAGAGDEVEFVSSKRKKAVPTQVDEVIVLD